MKTALPVPKPPSGVRRWLTM